MTRCFLPLVCGFQFEFSESVQPAWCMQVLMECLCFLQSSHLCLSFWSHTERDEASSGNSVHRVCVLPSQQAHPGFLSAWGMSCLGHSLHSPCPTQRLWVDLSGILKNPPQFLMHLQTPDEPSDSSLYGELLSMGFRGELMRWSAEITYFLVDWWISLVL